MINIPFSTVESTDETNYDKEKNIIKHCDNLMMTRFLDIKIGVKNIITNHRSNNFKSKLPVSGIKKIIKIVKKSQTVSTETSILFVKACELFIIELAFKSYANSLLNRRRTIQKNDIKNAVNSIVNYDFLIDILNDKTRNCLKKYGEMFNKSINDKDVIFDNLNFPSFETPHEKPFTNNDENDILLYYIKHYNNNKN